MEKKIAFGGLVCLLIAAFFSKGFHHFDEHFQILEFTGLKLGLLNANELPWEYHAKMRSSLQPSIAFLIHKLLAGLNLETPFRVALVLRWLSALLSWTAFCFLLKDFGKEIPEEWLKALVLPLTFFFWLSVYNGVRFSSENWGAIFFLFGLCSRKNPFWSGMLLGVSFLARFQMGLMIFGLGLWLFLIKKEKISRLIWMGVGFNLFLLLGLLLDRWFYGVWSLTFWNYLNENIFIGKAAQFGVQPWHEYFRILFVDLIPPFSVLFIFSLFSFFWLYPKHVFSFCLLPFLFVHMLLGHKEARFLFPLLYFFPIIIGLSFSSLFTKFVKGPKPGFVLKFLWGMFWIVNCLVLLAVVFQPADKDTELYEKIYRANPKRLIFTKDNPYMRAGFNLRYYQPPGLEVLSSDNPKATEEKVARTLIATLNFTSDVPEDRVVYRSAPSWIRRFNYNQWIDRTRLWVLFWQ